MYCFTCLGAGRSAELPCRSTPALLIAPSLQDDTLLHEDGHCLVQP